MPDNTPIYFNVDDPQTNADVARKRELMAAGVYLPKIIVYLKGVASVLGLGRTGAYAENNVLRALFDAIPVPITFGWQSHGGATSNREPRATVSGRVLPIVRRDPI